MGQANTVYHLQPSIKTVAAISRQLGNPKERYGKLALIGVSFMSDYIAGIACGIASPPAGVMVSKLNADRRGRFCQNFPGGFVS